MTELTTVPNAVIHKPARLAAMRARVLGRAVVAATLLVNSVAFAPACRVSCTGVLLQALVIHFVVYPLIYLNVDNFNLNSNLTNAATTMLL